MERLCALVLQNQFDSQLVVCSWDADGVGPDVFAPGFDEGFTLTDAAYGPDGDLYVVGWEQDATWALRIDASGTLAWAPRNTEVRCTNAVQRFGRCLRSIEACADQLVARVEDGMKPDESRCEQRQSAVCFSTVDIASGQGGNYCFPGDQVCEHFEERKRDSTPKVAVTSCTPYA